jgi:hypothetical protein
LPPEPGGDDANLEYTRKATDLALDYLKHNQDQALLDELGWSKDDMAQFIQRWEQLRAAARTPGPQGEQKRQELDDVLRGLGLRTGPDRLRAAGERSDAARGITDRGTRSRPPREYLDQYKAYLRNRQSSAAPQQ